MPKPDSQRPYLDTDNQEIYGKLASELGVSLSWIINIALRSVRLKISTTSSVKSGATKVGDKTITFKPINMKEYQL